MGVAGAASSERCRQIHGAVTCDNRVVPAAVGRRSCARLVLTAVERLRWRVRSRRRVLARARHDLAAVVAVDTDVAAERTGVGRRAVGYDVALLRRWIPARTRGPL